jgi:hypothetical protein
MGIELVSLGTFSFDMTDSVVLPESPAGTRVIVELSDARWDGERVRATQHGHTSGDWLTVGPDATATLDFRFVVATYDGALIYLTGHGRTDARTFATGGATYWTPRFETSTPAYRWLNAIQAIARGHADGKRVTFELYEAR